MTTRLTYRGVNYDVGTNYLPDGGLSRNEVSDADLARDIAAIRDQLYCNAVAVYGTPIDRLLAAAEVAREAGLHVFVQPRLIDADATTLADHVGRAAAGAEALRERWGEVTFNVGCELTIFSAGIIPGAGYGARTVALSRPWNWPRVPGYSRALNRLLSTFSGPLTYSAGLWERVDWRPFDLAGLDYYRMRRNRRRYAAVLARKVRGSKPVVITEFGCASYSGAADAGPAAHSIIDYGSDPPRIPERYVRDEQVQARELGELFDIFRRVGVHGAFAFEFIEPYYPHHPDPRRDLDMAGYALVRTGGADVLWQPKAAFTALAHQFGLLAEVPHDEHT
jgi:hypothetical protein